jgi:hypothetical protein
MVVPRAGQYTSSLEKRRKSAQTEISGDAGEKLSLHDHWRWERPNVSPIATLSSTTLVW